MKFVVVELGTSLCPFQMHIYSAFAEMERRRISERVKAGMRQARKNGAKIGNPRIEEAGRKGRQSQSNRSKVYVEDTMNIIAEIKAAGVKTQTGIAKALNARGVKTQRGKNWTQAHVLYILRKHERTLVLN